MENIEEQSEVLIVDDEYENLLVLSQCLSDAGFIISFALNGNDALKKIQTSMPDLILLDIGLPDISGYEVCSVVKSNHTTKNIPIIFLSAHQDVEAKVKGFTMGAVDYISKPYAFEETLMRVKTHLELKLLQNKTERQSLELQFINKNIQKEISKHKETGLKLQDSEDLLNEAGKIAKVGGWEYTIENQTLRWTDEVYNIYELDKTFMPTVNKAISYYTRESQPTITEALERAVKWNESFDLELDIVTAKGNYRLVRAIGKPKFTNNKITSILGVFQDISEKKRAEIYQQLHKEVEEENEEFRVLNNEIEAQNTEYKCLIDELNATKLKIEKSQELLTETGRIAKVGGWEFDTQTLQMNWTEEVYRIHEVDLSFKPTVIEGINFYSEWAKPIISEAVNRAITSGEPFDLELDIITAKGNLRWVHAKGKANYTNGIISSVSGVFQDITERKRNEIEIKEAKEHFELIFNTSPAAILITRLHDGYIVDYNDGFIKLTGFSNDEVVDKTVFNLNIWESSEQRKNFVFELTNNEYLQNYEAQFTKKDGQIIFGIVSAKIINIQGVPHILNIVRDISERKQVELEIQRKNVELIELIATKDKFFSIIAHDLKNPFNTILGFSELLHNNIEKYDNTKILKFANSIHSAATQTFTLLENLLEWSRLQRGMIVPRFMNLNLKFVANEIETVCAAAAKSKKIELINNIISDVYVEADNEMTKSIFRNLVSNAIKFTKSGFECYQVYKTLRRCKTRL